MAAYIHLAALVLLLSAVHVFTEDEEGFCAYMTAIPRLPKPDLPQPDFSGLTWDQRPFLPAPERDDLCMDQYEANNPSSGTQAIYMEEEIEGDITIAKLNYDGNQTPYIAQFLSGQRVRLGPEIRNVSGEWHLIITERQDYESPGMQRYLFNVRVDDRTLVASVLLLIVNIDDNPPRIELFDTCQVPELGDAPRLTECVYEVSDADGEISTRFMTFRIDSDRGDDQIFFIEGSNIQGTWMRMHMTVGINRTLNFETNVLHIFSVTAFDSLPNNNTVTMMVQVENVEHRPPRWLEIFAVQQFDEKTNQSFTVNAIDGDTGIDRPICYKLETAEEDTFFDIETIEGGRSGGIFNVTSIDRDYLQREIFRLSIIAYKCDNDTFSITTNVVIIVNDINDQIPEPIQKEYHIRIPEETPLTFNFGEQEFGFHDRDLGENAQYEVHLESVEPPGAAEALYIAPGVGYQRQTFIMGTQNHSMLDYEVPEFQNITIRVVATDMNNTNFVGEAMLYIELINWNDEEPIFEENSVSVSFNETEGAGFFVATVKASDRDIGDRVEHTLMGNAGNFLRIDQDTGNVYVAIDDAFDYHTQSELFIQVRADDTLMEPYNTATSQLHIQLNDINNTPPTLRLPRRSPQVEENVPEGYEITEEIFATDPDTTALLVFEIDWDTSYATKQGQDTDPIEFLDCIEIETVYPNENNTGSALGRVVVKEIRTNVTIDYEMFEVLYVTVRVRDLNTVLGDDYDELLFTIVIIDMNDNRPLWTEGSLEQNFRVREMSDSDIVIGSVLATDIDGPMYNQVRYTITPRNNTPEGLVKIDFQSGQLTVDTRNAIDADDPPRLNLYYTVVASDRCFAENITECPPDPTYWNTEGEITIYIIDTNNKVPQAETDQFDTVVYIYENATSGDPVEFLKSSDLDRDEMYHTVSYQINYGVNPRLRYFFEVDIETGLLYVHYTTDETLDRDGDEPEHRVFINLVDNFLSEGDGNRNQNNTEVLVVLLDVNDNAPELPEPHELSWSISEGLTEGVRLQPDIYAPDRDQPDHDNSRVGYAILNLTVTNRDIEVPELFTMIQIENVTGELETAMDLKGYWGTYAIHIQAYDHGIPQQISDEVYELVINPYNFHAPVFQYPLHGTTIRLAKELTVAGGLLVLVNGEFMDRIFATDEDGLHAGTVTFSITGNAEAVEYFTVINQVDNSGALSISSTFPENIREFQAKPVPWTLETDKAAILGFCCLKVAREITGTSEVTIRATDGGTEPGPLFTESTVTLVFVPTQGEPTFATNTASVAIFEKEGGLEERHQLPLADDEKNHLCDGDCVNIYYRIQEGNGDGHFALDPEQNILYVVRELDREVAASHVLTIVASNSPTATGVGIPSATLTVTVNVREANPRPSFLRDLYTAGISTLDNINRELFTVQAVHSEGSPITYSIDQESMVVDSSLSAVRDTAFAMNPTTGALTLNMQPTAAMHGTFEFDIVATDPVGAYDRAQARVYLISTLNRVFFIFVNTVEQVENNRGFIAQTFSAGFNMTCNVDQVLPFSNSNGVALNDTTEVRAHFIQNNVPVSADVIEQIRSDTQLLRTIQLTLNTELLILRDFVTESSPDTGTDANRITVYVLAALSVILGFMCFVLLITFIVRTRALNRRLEALSMTKYGSVDSGLNRVGIAAPGTNKHAIEGSNPIWNETIKAPDFDAVSDASYDSDLIGIEDLPQFKSDYFPPEDTNSVQDIIVPPYVNGPLADHSNNFGFKTNPFSSDFANTNFKR